MGAPSTSGAPGESTDGSPLEDRMVFAFGVPRSGTYWLQRILTAHPEVAAVPNETHLFSKAVAPFLANFHHSAIGSPSVSAIYADRGRLIGGLRALCDGILGIHLDGGARLLCERSAWHVQHVGLMAEIYPDARFVHIIRDPRDVARSMVAHDWGPDQLAEAATQWRQSILMARGANAPRYLEVRYEQLLADVPAAAEHLYGWLGLDASEEAISAAGADAEVHVNVDPGRTGVGAEKWRAHLNPDQVRSVERAAGELMEELGYEPSDGAGAGGTPRPSLRSRIAGAVRGPQDDRPGPASTERHDPVTAVATFDRLLTVIHTGRTEELGSILSSDATVHMLSGAGEELLRKGGEALIALQRAVADDAALAGEQVHSSVHSTFPTTFALLTYRLDDGSRARRLLVASARGERIEHVTLQRL